MKSKQLLSIVFSLIMFTGVSAGSAAFAETDELDDLLEDFCEIDAAEHDAFFDENPDLADFRDEITDFCTIEDEIEREDAIDVFVEENFPEAIEEDDEVIDDFEDCVEAGYPVMESYPEQCMTDDGTVFVNDEQVDDYDDDYDDDRYAKGDKFYVCHNGKETISIAESAVREHLSHGDSMRKCHDGERDYDRDYIKDKMHTDKDMRHSLEKYCEMSEDDRAAYIAEHDKDAEKSAKMDRYCTLDENGRTDFIAEHLDEYKAYMKDKMKDKKHMDYDRLCSMAASDRASEITDVAKLDRISKWCDMTPEERDDYKRNHPDSMKDKMTDFKKDFMKDQITDFKKETKMLVDGMKDKHKEYSRYCDMTEEERAASIDSLAKLERISEWCEMTPEERDAFKKENRDAAKDLKEKRHDALERMKDNSDLSPRLRAMIMEKHDISDDRRDEIKMKFEEKHGDKSDKKRTEIKMKFKNHMATIKIKMSDERKSAIHDRLVEMKEFKSELRERSSDMTDEEKQALRAEFIEKAKDMQLAWISPRHQMHAGVDATEIECREGFSHVLKASNGMAMCLKADTALKMIDKGYAVPAN